MNYIKIINWFWEEVPYMKGFKAVHSALFFAICDSINKNNWGQNTPIAYDRIISKIRVSKQVYLDAREWLQVNGIIEIKAGKNAYQMATFNLGVEVINQTATLTGNITANDTATRPLTLPIIKHINNKPKKNKLINIPFETFWESYDKKVGNKEKIEKLWGMLKDEERILAISHVKEYKAQTSDKQFRKNPETYLRNKSFNDEIISTNGNNNNNRCKENSSIAREIEEKRAEEILSA